MSEDLPTQPKFRIDKSGKQPRVFVQCSKCDVDLRELKPHESIAVTRAYFCDDCDPGAIVLNPAHDAPSADPFVRTECIRFVKRWQTEKEAWPETPRQLRILQQLWVNPRLPDGQNKQWRDVPCVEEESDV